MFTRAVTVVMIFENGGQSLFPPLIIIFFFADSNFSLLLSAEERENSLHLLLHLQLRNIVKNILGGVEITT